MAIEHLQILLAGVPFSPFNFTSINQLDNRKEFSLSLRKLSFVSKLSVKFLSGLRVLCSVVKCPLTLPHRHHLCQAPVALCQARLKYPYSVYFESR